MIVTKGLLHPLYLLAGYSVLGWNHPGFAGSSVSLFIYYHCNTVSNNYYCFLFLIGFNPPPPPN